MKLPEHAASLVNLPEHTASLVNLPEHSPVGASGASRWLKCPGSVPLSQGCVDEESEFAKEGSAAHALGEHCLANDVDAWEMVGAIIGDEGIVEGATSDYELIKNATTTVDKDMADAVQEYLNAVRWTHPDRDEANSFIEYKFHCPSIHPLFYGMSDEVYIDYANRTLHVWDYKHGAGIIVSVIDNPQGKYYGVGVLEAMDLWDKIDRVMIHIAQPRSWSDHITEWAIGTAELEDWLEDELIPGMDNALTSRDTASGDNCRFCPARGYACPQIMQDMDELEEIVALANKKGGAAELSNAQVGRFLDLLDVAKIVGTAAGKTAFGRLSAGQKIPGRKLAQSKKNREWNDKAERAIKAKFGDDAITDPALKSPAQIDKLPEGKKYSARYAFKPAGSLTVVKADDSRSEVSRDTKSLFTAAAKKRKS